MQPPFFCSIYKRQRMCYDIDSLKREHNHNWPLPSSGLLGFWKGCEILMHANFFAPLEKCSHRLCTPLCIPFIKLQKNRVLAIYKGCGKKVGCSPQKKNLIVCILVPSPHTFNKGSHQREPLFRTVDMKTGGEMMDTAKFAISIFPPVFMSTSLLLFSFFT